MGSESPRQIAAAITVLVLALGLLGYQVYRRVGPGGSSSTTGGSEVSAEMMEDVAVVVPEPLAVLAPDTDARSVLRHNPFLRPPVPGANGAAVERTASSHAKYGELQVTGIRTGARPMVIIDDRFRWVGDSVREWRILAIHRDRVTLERSDGRTIDLVLR